VPRRIGYNRDGRGWMLTDRLEPLRNGRKFTPAPMIPYYNEIGRRLGCESFCKIPELFTTPDEEAAVDKLLEEMNVVPGQPIVALNPGGSFGPAKCWPPERFARVADTLAGELGGAVYINYGPSENEVRIAREVAGHMKMPTLVRDKPLLPIGGSKAMIKRSTILITNDTGPRHYANAFGVPVVTVFGPTDPMWTLTETDRERSLIIPVECGPCQQPVCPEGHHKCMQLLDVDMVLTAARELLMDFARGN
jgi:heptosyltransferase-2